MAKGMHKPKGLATRIKAFEDHGKNPNMTRNPSNGTGQGHDMHRPGSFKK